jgi:hypothetical protein
MEPKRYTMPSGESEPVEIEAILRGFLPEALERSGSQGATPAPTTDDLFDLVEGRLSATEREALIERLVQHPRALSQLADLLEGHRGEEAPASEQTAQGSMAAWMRPLFRLHILIPAASLALILLVAVPMFYSPDGSPTRERGLHFRDVPFDELAEPTVAPVATASGVGSATAEIETSTPEDR